MKNKKMNVYVRVLIPWSILGDKVYEPLLYDTIAELVSLPGILEFWFDEFGLKKPKIKHVENINELNKILKLLEPLKIPIDYEILKFWLDVPPMDEKLVAEYGDLAEILHLSHYASLFKKNIQDLIVLANIARVGSFHVDYGVIIYDNEVIDKIESINPGLLRASATLVTATGWPILKSFSLQKVWCWAIKQKGFIEGIGGGKIGRALNALTYLFDVSVGPLELFWTLVGIEALYVKGTGSLSEQVREKSQALLGIQKSYKKQFSQMYDFRSRFVHGDLDFPGRHLIYDALDSVNDYYRGSGQASDFALAILIATIQELIDRDCDNIEFSYKVNNEAIDTITEINNT